MVNLIPFVDSHGSTQRINQKDPILTSHKSLAEYLGFSSAEEMIAAQRNDTGKRLYNVVKGEQGIETDSLPS